MNAIVSVMCVCIQKRKRKKAYPIKVSEACNLHFFLQLSILFLSIFFLVTGKLDAHERCKVLQDLTVWYIVQVKLTPVGGEVTFTVLLFTNSAYILSACVSFKHLKRKGNNCKQHDLVYIDHEYRVSANNIIDSCNSMARQCDDEIDCINVGENASHQQVTRS